MHKIAAAFLLSGGLLLVGQPAKGFIPRPVEEPRAAAPHTQAQATATAIAKKAKAAKKGGGDKKADKDQAAPSSSGGGAGGGKQKPFPSKAEALKDIDDISKK